MSDFQTFISVRDLTIRYKDFIAVNGVSFEISKGLTYLLGPNGSGKSSIIKALTGIIKPYKGEVVVLGCNPLDTSCLNDRLHVAFEETMLPGHLSVKDYLESIAYIRGYEKDMSEIYELLDLKSHLNKKISELSKGLRRRVTLTTLFIGSPEIIIIDEPYNGLDIKSSIILNRIITKYISEHPGTAVLISTHIIPPIKPDKIILLSNGRIIYDDNPPEESIKVRVKQGETIRTMTLVQLNRILHSMGSNISILGVEKETIYDFIEKKIFGDKPI